MAVNGALRNNPGSFDDVIRGVNRKMSGIRRIIGIFIKLELIVNKVTLRFQFLSSSLNIRKDEKQLWYIIIFSVPAF